MTIEMIVTLYLLKTYQEYDYTAHVDDYMLALRPIYLELANESETWLDYAKGKVKS